MLRTGYIRSTAPTIKWVRQNIHNNSRAIHSAQAETSIDPRDSKQEFMAVWPEIMRDISDGHEEADIPEVTNWFKKVLQHVVANTNKNKGLIVPATYKALEDSKNLTQDSIKLANIMGWCVEILQSSLILQDDIFDSSDTRRGETSWHKQQGVGWTAINDSMLLQYGGYSILRQYFSKSPMYIQCLELSLDIMLKLVMGEAADSLFKLQANTNLDDFTLKRYNSLSTYKSQYFSFLYPATLGMYLTNKFDPELYRHVKPVLMKLGYLLHIQNDFADVFVDPSHDGRIGTDIQEGKCSWLIVTAMQRASTAQKSILKENYGSYDTDAVLAVKNVYQELNLPRIYEAYEEEILHNIRSQVEHMSKHLPYKLFFKYLRSLAARRNWTATEWWYT